MPLQKHPGLAIPLTEPYNDVAWMSAVLSPSVADAPPRLATHFSLDDAPAHLIGSDLPPSSFRLQFLRAWIAARESRPAEATGHA